MNAINETTRKLVNLEVTDDGRLKTTGSGGGGGGGAVDSVNGEVGVVVLDATDVGADPAGSAADALSDANDYTDAAISGLPGSPVTSVNGDTGVVVLTAADVGAATPADVAAAVAALVASSPATLDTLDELAAALGDDPNFATTTATAIGLKAPIDNPTFTGTVGGITKSMVGLGNVDNTTDAGKPVSTAQGAAIDAKVEDNLTASTTVAPSKTAVNTGLALKAAKAGDTFTGPVITAASATGGAGFRLPHGAAPSSPTNGDIWTTTSGLLARINGATVGPFLATASVTGFTASLNTSSPNNTVNASRLLASGGTTNQDWVLSPKGTGAIIAALPDNSTPGGNKRGIYAVDLQTVARSVNTEVASGDYSVIPGGYRNTASGAQAFAAGFSSVSSGNTSFAMGYTCTASHNYAIAMGNTSSATASDAIAIGSSAAATASNAIALGLAANASAAGAVVIGPSAASGSYALAAGVSCTADGISSIAFGKGAITRGVDGSWAWQSNNDRGAAGNQAHDVILQAQTTSTSGVVATVDGAAASAANQLKVPTSSALRVRGEVAFRDVALGSSGGFEFRALLKEVSGTVSLVSTTTEAFEGDALLNACTCVVTADNTNKSVKVTVTGKAATTINWTIRLSSIINQ